MKNKNREARSLRNQIESNTSILQTRQKEIAELDTTLRHQRENLARQSAIIRSQKSALIFSLISLAAVITTIFFIHRAYRIKRDSNLELEDKNSQLVSSQNETQQGLQQLKATQEELLLAKNQAIQANQAKSVFLANMSHEIRTPMNAILGFTEILREKEEAPQKKRYLNNIFTSSQTLLTLIDDILDLSKVEAGKLDLQYGSVSLISLFEELKIIFKNLIVTKGT